MNPLPVEDLEEIRALTVRYMFHLDRFDAEKLRACLTDDIVWDGSREGLGRHEGIDALMEFFTRGQPGEPLPTRAAHIVTNHLVETAEGDEARGICYFLGQSLYAVSGVKIEVGFYRDTYRREGGRWRISGRVLHPLLAPRFDPSLLEAT